MNTENQNFGSLLQEILKEWVEYKDGQLFWRKSPKYDIKIGEQLGSVRRDGYVEVGFKGNRYLLHRLIFLYHHGYLPELVDHINQDHTDNRIENLREFSKKENVYNTSKVWSHNTSGIRGVSWDTQRSKWSARLKQGDKYLFLGYFSDKESASEARLAAERRFLQ